MNLIELEPETRDVLDRIRHSSTVLSIYEMPADLAEAGRTGRGERIEERGVRREN